MNEYLPVRADGVRRVRRDVSSLVSVPAPRSTASNVSLVDMSLASKLSSFPKTRLDLLVIDLFLIIWEFEAFLPRSLSSIVVLACFAS